MTHNIYELFVSRFAGVVDDVFLATPGEPSFTYADIERRSASFARALVDAGTLLGDRVVVQVDKSADAVALYLACVRAGFVYVPLNTAYTAEEVGYFIGDAEASVFVFTPGRASKLQPVGELAGVERMYTLGTRGNGTLAEAASEAGPGFGVTEREADDVACMLYTSGTTGRSKGAMITHANLASNALALHAIWRWEPGDVLLHALPVFHVHGLFVALHCAILNGSKVIFLPHFDVDDVRSYLPSATVMMGVPTYYSRLLEDPDFGPEDCATIRLFTSGSAPLTSTVFRQFADRTGHTICERYGMTETGIITSNPPEGPKIAGTVGYPLPKVDVRVVDDDDRVLGPDEIGTVQVKGPNVFPGYWRLPDRTAAEITADGYFRTGDIGSMAPDGRLTLVGRSSDMIISGGYNVYPKEIEIVLDEIDGVMETAVVGLPHPDFGEGVAAFVVADPDLIRPPAAPEGHEPATVEAAIEQRMRSAVERLANFKRPKAYLFVDELPRNAMGKVQKTMLRTDHSEAFALLDL
ncbi:MAG: AMP-binding protein [Acidimicrobiales bacterium]